MTGAEFRTYAARTDDANPLSIFDHDDPPASASAAPPACLDDDLLPALAAHAGPLVAGGASAAARLVAGERAWVVAGGVAAGVPWHVDPFGTAAYNVLLDGAKLWAFFEPAAPGNTPPGTTRDASPPPRDWFVDFEHFFRADAAFDEPRDHAGRLSWAIQRAGDAVLLPPDTWHATLNLDASTVAYTRNVVDARCRRGVKRAARLLADDDASLQGCLERLVRQRRAE